ncbi:MAG: nucleotide exchange factor GrpE [Candidatus Liptonbacteria bacterium]|nr:nucleotide exchange factor GrpE [Candidatus Liptonbacteria bacterium]
MDEIKKDETQNTDPSTSSTSSPQASPEEKLAACEKQRDEYLAGWQRAKADFLNYKKDESRRFEDLIRYANEDLLEELIGVLDSFDLGLAALEKAGPVERGVYMIHSKLDDIMKQRGLIRLPVKVGDKFDPLLSETIVEIESEQPAGTILEIIESGYKLHDKILRPARVKVSKEKNKQE